MSASAIFILIFYIIILIPCIGVGWVGFRMITRLGRYPSKSRAIQMSVLLQLLVIEVVSFSLIVGFFKVLSTE